MENTNEMRYALHITPETAEWLVKFAATGLKSATVKDRAAFAQFIDGPDAFRASMGDKVEPNEDGTRVYAVYLPMFNEDGMSCAEIMNRVADVLGKRSGRSKIDKAAITELRNELPGAMADAYECRADGTAVTIGSTPVGVVASEASVTATGPVESAARVVESAPVADAPAPVAAGDVVAHIAVTVGAMLNTWADVAERAATLTPADRKAYGDRLAEAFALTVAFQRDADGSGRSLGDVDADANRIMFAARKMLRHFHAVITGNPKGERIPKGARRTFRKAVAPWRADASASLPA